jgi:hypothetical protein
MFGPQLRTRLNARAGKILDWWANQTAEGRPRAVVLGDWALVKAEPTRNDRGAPATLVVTTQLHTASFRFIEVAERADAGSSHGHGGMRPGRREMVAPGPRLDEQMTAFLGNLPAKAQVFLQAPFLNDFAGLDYERYYFRTNDAAGEELFVGCYLANGHQLTFASGIRRIWTGIPTAAWQLICRQATIIDPSHQRS